MPSSQYSDYHPLPTYSWSFSRVGAAHITYHARSKASCLRVEGTSDDLRLYLQSVPSGGLADFEIKTGVRQLLRVAWAPTVRFLDYCSPKASTSRSPFPFLKCHDHSAMTWHKASLLLLGVVVPIALGKEQAHATPNKSVQDVTQQVRARFRLPMLLPSRRYYLRRVAVFRPAAAGTFRGSFLRASSCTYNG